MPDAFLNLKVLVGDKPHIGVPILQLIFSLMMGCEVADGHRGDGMVIQDAYFPGVGAHTMDLFSDCHTWQCYWNSHPSI